MKKPFVILIVLIVIVVGLVGVRSIVANEISTSGVALGDTQNETNRIKIENAMLQEEILKYSSLSYVASSAAEQGFLKSKTNFALKKASSIALKQ